LTGLEPYTLLVKWQPTLEHQLLNGRDKEGTYLLLIIPGNGTNIRPEKFVEGSYIHIQKTLIAVKNKWTINSKERDEWIDWEKNYAPQSDNVDDYLNNEGDMRLKYRRKQAFNFYVPCRSYLLDKNKVYGSLADIATPLVEVVNHGFPWPTAAGILYSTASVRQQNNLNPPPPTVTFGSANENSVVSRYKRDSVIYYEEMIPKDYKIADLKSILQRKLTLHGKSVSYSGNKQDLIDRIKRIDIECIRSIFKPLNNIDRESLNEILDDNVLNNRIVCTINNFHVKQSEFRCGRSNEPISTNIMNLFMKLFENRDIALCTAHQDVNQNDRFYVKRKLSHFGDILLLGDQILSMDGENNYLPSIVVRVEEYIFSIIDKLFDFHKVYLPFYSLNGIGLFLLVIDPVKKEYKIIDPSVNDTLQSKELWQERLNFIGAELNRILSTVRQADDNQNVGIEINWKCELHSYLPFSNNGFIAYDRVDMNHVNEVGIFC
jgi:hypothetical protein